MALLQSYAVWNNKGGVGKSTITFHAAIRYAERHPAQDVLVIDLCPQANASMMLLGGGDSGEAAVLDACTAPIPRTVVGYLSRVIANGSGAPLPNPMDFIGPVAQTNAKLPENLYLICGDGNLEPMAPAIAGTAAQPVLVPGAEPWRWVHSIFRALIDNLVANSARDWVVFVDTNPSFSIYTELAVCAVNRLITPVNADDSSRVATNAMFVLLHGQNPPHPIYGTWTFAAKASAQNLAVPQIHLVVGNRLTQYAGAAAAFGAMSDATANTLFEAFQSHPNYFTPRARVPTTLAQFRRDYSIPLRDFNTAGVAAAHLGLRLSAMGGGWYDVARARVQLNADRIQECLTAVDGVVALL
jgi:cellulose biosynthesis protein BcsQ